MHQSKALFFSQRYIGNHWFYYSSFWGTPTTKGSIYNFLIIFFSFFIIFLKIKIPQYPLVRYNSGHIYLFPPNLHMYRNWPPRTFNAFVVPKLPLYHRKAMANLIQTWQAIWAVAPSILLLWADFFINLWIYTYLQWISGPFLITCLKDRNIALVLLTPAGKLNLR